MICVLRAFAFFFFFQAEDGIRDLVRSRGLGDVYKRQVLLFAYLGIYFYDAYSIKLDMKLSLVVIIMAVDLSLINILPLRPAV